MQLTPSCFHILLDPNTAIFLNALSSPTFDLRPSLSMSEQSVHSWKCNGKITLFYVSVATMFVSRRKDKTFWKKKGI